MNIELKEELIDQVGFLFIFNYSLQLLFEYSILQSILMMITIIERE